MAMVDSQQSILLSLAPELIQAIGSELDLSDACQLRLTCKDMAKFLDCQLFRSLTLDITRRKMEKGLSQLEALSGGNHAACHAVRKLVIQSLSPSYNPTDHRFVCSLGRRGARQAVKSADHEPAEVVSAIERMDAQLFGALTSLKGIQSVEWIPNSKDSERTHQIVMDALKHLPDLYRLRVYLPNLKNALELHSLKNLQEIALMEMSQTYQEDILESLAKAVAQNSGLTSIDISNSWRYHRTIENFQNLHQLFKYVTAATPIRLRHLSLRMCLVRLDSITLPHLTHLTSLSLTSIEDPYAAHRVARGPFSSRPTEDSVMIQERKRYGSKLEDIWKALMHAGVHLEEITVDAVPISFLDYLASYSGLKRLRLTPDGFYSGTYSDAVARQFFDASLTSHAQTLEDLQIPALFEGLWCFGTHNVEIISKCTKLKQLRMGIISFHLATDRSQDKNLTTEKSDVIKLILDTVVLCMPDIDTVQVTGANLEVLRGTMCGNPSMHHFDHVNERMTHSISSYEAPISCRRLPILMLGSGGSFYTNKRTWYSGADLRKEGGSKQGPTRLRYTNDGPTAGYHGW